jgi:glycosyltransferase involved in cell wall biosynthesis
MMSYVLARADCVVLDSYAHFEACVKLGCDPGKIVRLPWIDSGELIRYSEAIERRRDEFRNSLVWSAGDVVIICTRSHAPIYDVECIVKSAPMVLKQCPDVRFLFVGNGPLTEKLKRLAVSLGITKNVHFTGYLDRRQLLECLINSDIYVSSSLSDGTSASLMEAMASKLPCVVSDIPGNREWISNNENGLLFATRDSHSLATHLVDLIRDDARRAELGALGYETTKMRANWESNSGQLVSAIQSLGSAA